jgi:hypothetical protein
MKKVAKGMPLVAFKQVSGGLGGFEGMNLKAFPPQFPLRA